MTTAQKLRAEFWPTGSVCSAIEVTRESNGNIRIHHDIPNGEGHLFLVSSENRRYALGHFEVQSKILTRPRIFDLSTSSKEQVTHALESHIVETSATKRIHGCLQKIPNLLLELHAGSNKYELRTIPMQKGSASRFFICKGDLPALPPDTNEFLCVIYLFDVPYAFHGHVLDHAEGQLAIALPHSVRRIAKRVLIRTGQDWTITIDNDGASTKKFTVVDFSLNGLCVSALDPSIHPIWSEVGLMIASPNHEFPIPAHALVVEHSEKGTHLLLGSDDSIKLRFYSMCGFLDSSCTLEENPEKAWQCLEQFSYLDLMDKGTLDSLKSVCLNTWGETLASPLAMLPVAISNNVAQGTYGLFKGGVDHWFHHLLAVQFGPNAIPAAHSLYNAWPQYLAARSEAAWVTAWYDPTKTWHNRFCQTFIKEHQDHPEAVTFDRHWFWVRDIESSLKPTSGPAFELKPVNDAPAEVQKQTRDLIRSRYGTKLPVPVLPEMCRYEAAKSNGVEWNFQEYCIAITLGGEVAGYVLICKSNHDSNPFSISNCAHINLVNAAQKENAKDLEHLVNLVLTWLKTEGFTKAAFTVDFDVNPQLLTECGYKYFTVLRCLSFSTRLLSDWISNNNLSFSDLANRANV